jgi:biopolymer transport protein ExbD
MSRFNKNGGREMPELNTSSLPDLIFTILFFFMMVTSMRQETLKVKYTIPSGTQLEKLARKSCTSYIHIGKPTDALAAEYGTNTRIQLNDKYAEPYEIGKFVTEEQGSIAESLKPFFTVSLKCDKEAPMGIITDVKQKLREAYALKIVYSASKKNQ